MATAYPTWTEDISLSTSATLGASGTDTDDIDLSANNYDMVVVQWRGTFNASATDGVTIEVFASPDSGTTDDTVAVYSFTLDTTGAAAAISFVIEDLPYVAIKRTNLDSTYTITSEVIDYAARQWTIVG